MSVHSSIRLPAAAGETLAAAGDVPAAAADLFTALVAGLSGAPAAPGAPVADPDTEAAPAGETESAKAPGADITAAVEQLLALVVGPRGGQPHGKGTEKDAPADDAPTASPDGDAAAATAAPTADPASVALAAAALPAAPILAAAASPAQAPAAAPAASATPLPLATATPSPAGLPALAGLIAPRPAGARPAQAGTDPNLQPASGDAFAPQAEPKQAPAPAAAPSSHATPARPLDAGAVQAMVRSLIAGLGGEAAAKPAERGRAGPLAAAVALARVADVQSADTALLGASLQAQAPAAAPADAATAAPLQGLVIERQLDLAHQGEWIDQLARDIANAAGGDGQTLRFRLNPEHLGTLHVEIAQSQHGAAVRFSTDSDAARNLIADAQPRLVAEARAQGVRISEAHVDLGGSGAGDPRRQPTAGPDAVPIRTARSLQDETGSDGKPSRDEQDLYA